MTALNILVKNGVFQTEDVNQKFNLNATRDCFIKTQKDIVRAMQEYARLKCEELLEIVAEKAEVYRSEGGYENWVDKDSVLNAVDLDEFIV
jgi:hypothetical protein